MLRRALSLASLAFATSAVAQLTLSPDGSSIPPGVIGGDGQVVVIPGGGAPGGGSPGGIPIDVGGGVPINPGDGGIIGGGSGGLTEATILVPRGAVAGETVTALAFVPGDASNATYQWSLSGARAVSGTRSARLEFVADRAGSVALTLTVGVNGTSYTPSATVTIVSAASAGTISVPATATPHDTVTASITAGSSGERTFRWSISGDATIAGPRDTATFTFQPRSPGVHELTCSVNVQNLVTVPLRATVIVHGDGPPVSVVVNNGSGGGTFNARSRLHVFAHPPAAGQVFDRWTGDVDALDASDPVAALSPHALLTVPARSITLTATYRTAPAWTPTTIANFAGAQTPFLHHVPANARGLVFLLHDTGADAASWFNRPEPLLLARHLVAAGFGVAALESAQRTPSATWSQDASPTANPDARNHLAALERLTRDNLLRADAPVFFLGVGAGANAAAHIAHQLSTTAAGSRVKAAVLFHGASTELLAVTSRVPHLFINGNAGETTALLATIEARSNAQLLTGRGISAESATAVRGPVHPERFRALAATTPTFSAADAQAIWQALKEADVLDPNFYVRSIPSRTELEPLLPAAHRPRAADVAAQLAIANAHAELSSAFAPRIVAFLDARVSGAAAPEPGRIANLSTRTQIAFLGDIFQLGFNLSGREPATLLIRGVGPGLARFRVDTGLPAPRLELRRGTTLLAANQRWDDIDPARLDAAAASVGAFPLAPGELDTALLLTLDPGTYVASLQGLDGAVGDILVEVYDVSRNSTRLTNLSTLGRIHAEGDVLVPGIVVSGTQPRTFLTRAIGPGLADVGFTSESILGDPRLSVLNHAGAIVDSNQNWSTSTAALSAVFPLVGAFPLKNDSSDAAALTALAPGNYTLQVAAATFTLIPGGSSQAATSPANPTGTVLVEIYEVP